MEVQLQSVSIPSFMSFDSLPITEQQERNQQPLSGKRLINEAIKKIALATISGIVAGVVIGAAISVPIYLGSSITSLLLISPATSIKSVVYLIHLIFLKSTSILAFSTKIGSLIAGLLSFSDGIYSASKFLNQSHIVQTYMRDTKIQNTINSCITNYVEDEFNGIEDGLECAISQNIMAFPVHLGCGNKESPHTFDYTAILKHFSKIDNCPFCRLEKNVSHITLNQTVEKKILTIAHRIFQVAESFLKKIPEEAFSRARNFEEPQLINKIFQEITNNKIPFHNQNSSQIIEKIIKTPEKLSDIETYIVAYYFTYQFSPILKSIFSSSHAIRNSLQALLEKEKIDREEYDKRVEEIGLLYHRKVKEIFTPEFPVILEYSC